MIAKMFKNCGFVNIDYLVRNRLETKPSKILNILNRDWRKWVKPVCMLDGGGLDPNFGYETIGTAGYDTLEDGIYGSVFTIAEDGTADLIKAAIRCTVEAKKMKCAIYKHSDLSLVGQTEEVLVPVTDPANWITFNFTAPKPSLTANTAYILVAWSYSSVGYARLSFDAGDANQGHWQLLTYNGFPNPLNPGHADFKYSIYCTYTTLAKPLVTHVRIR